MGLSEFDPAAHERVSWNAGRKVGAKRASSLVRSELSASFSTNIDASGIGHSSISPSIANYAAATW